jgi:hypothetical protein
MADKLVWPDGFIEAINAIPSAGATPETWTFEMEDSSTVQKLVYVDGVQSSNGEMITYAEL